MDSAFFQDYGLYKKYAFKLSHRNLPALPSPSLQRFCEKCSGERTWCEDFHLRRCCDTQLPEGVTVIGHVINFTFYCVACHSERVHFQVRFEQSEKSGGNYDKCLVSKVGQYPPFDITIDPSLRAAIGKHLPTFKKGIICEKQGFGIGAFAYYRRIVELIIDELLLDIRIVLDDTERDRYDAVLSHLQSSIVAQKKIAVVKELLPNVLRPGGQNPLGLLHDALSHGIHGLEDEDCIDFAMAIRKSLVSLTKHIALAKEEKDTIGNDFNMLREKLDRVREREKLIGNASSNENTPP